MGNEDAKVALIAALNEDTIRQLDTYITMQGGEELTRLETMAQRLNKASYPQVLSYLKQGNLQELAHQGAGATLPNRSAKKAHKVGFSNIHVASTNSPLQNSSINAVGFKWGQASSASQAPVDRSPPQNNQKPSRKPVKWEDLLIDKPRGEHYNTQKPSKFQYPPQPRHGDSYRAVPVTKD